MSRRASTTEPGGIVDSGELRVTPTVDDGQSSAAPPLVDASEDVPRNGLSHQSISDTDLESVPYPHQVGGHGQLRILSSGKLLKPLYDKELRFYQFIHSPTFPASMHWLRYTTPWFFGEMPTPSPSSTSNSSDTELSNQTRAPVQWVEDASATFMSMSPWAITMGKRVKTKKSSSRPGMSICLEDINKQFKIPCVLDCKIGTRQYDDDATAEKRRRHIAKSEMTTSAKHGIRFTGMQSYKRQRAYDAGAVYEFRDKYHGRRLSGSDLIPEMRWFFHDGGRMRIECVRIILEKLLHIRKYMTKQRQFKFYSSSLLLVYEGAPREEVPCHAEVRMIDFAHTQWVKGEDDKIDDGYLLGIDSLIEIMKTLLKPIPDDNERVSDSVFGSSGPAATEAASA